MPALLMLLLGGLLVFAAIALLLSLIGVITAERRGVARSLAAIESIDRAPDAVRQELERPFTERVIAPLGEQAVGFGRKITRAEAPQQIQHRLDIAGNPPGWDVNRILGLKFIGAAGFGVLGLLYLLTVLSSPLLVLLGAVGFAGFGYTLPNLLLFNSGQKREQGMQRTLPDALDMLTISVEAGLGFEAAVARVARNTKGPLAMEFARLLQEMQLGIGRTEAIRAMGERSSLRDLKSFCLAMVQADSLGIPIGKVLRVQSREMRVKRRQRAEEKAQQVPVKILIPLVLFILPSLFLVVGGPAAIRMIEMFGATGGQ